MITTGNWQDALEPIAIKNFEVGFEEIPDELKMIYTVKKSSKLTETYLEIGDFGSMGVFNGNLDYDDTEQGYKMTITATELAKGLKIQRKFVETDQLDIVEGLPKHLGLSANRRMALDVMYPFNNAFNSASATLDTLSLCNAAHTSNNGGSNQSNAGSTAMSAPAVEATRILMKKFLTNKDQRFLVNPDTIICGQDLAQTAYEIVSSAGKVDTALNNANFHKGKYKVIVSDWLESSKNWFMVDSKLMKHFMVWNNVVPLEFGQDRDFDGMVAKYRAYTFYGFGAKDWRFIYGHQPA